MGIGWISGLQYAGALNGGAAAEPTAPAQFGTGDWSVADDETGGDITITITALPDNGGSAITDLEYQLDGGSWVSLSDTTTGDYPVSGLTDDQEYDVSIRAVNTVGNGTASATKAVTPTTAFSPLDLTPTAWYDPSDLTTLFQDAAGTTPVTTHGDVVGRINDKSGNSWTLTQGTTAAKPLYQTDGTLHWLFFDGVDDKLVSASMAFLPVSGHHSAVASARSATVAASQGSILGYDSGSGSSRVSQMLRRNATAIDSVAFNASTVAFTDVAGTAIAADEDFVASELTASNAVEAFKNGVGNGSTAITGTMRQATTVLVMGSLHAAGAQFWSGRIYQAVVLPRAWTAGEKTSLETYVGAKAGVTL